MERDLKDILMVTLISANSNMAEPMEKAFTHGEMVKFMMESGIKG